MTTDEAVIEFGIPARVYVQCDPESGHVKRVVIWALPHVVTVSDLEAAPESVTVPQLEQALERVNGTVWEPLTQLPPSVLWES